MISPLHVLLQKYPLLILDGALATELERQGYSLDDPLWSAKVLIEHPEAIRTVHEEYLKAGADCLITASYQASIVGFMQRGYSEEKSADLLRLSVLLAKQARERVWAQKETRKGRPFPLVAASIGPYGAYLADGSEYRGAYRLKENDLMDFHKKRLAILIQAEPDILACETLPCLSEAKALVRLLQEYPEMSCWVSFSAQNGQQISNGEYMEDCARFLHEKKQVAAIGINCTAPVFIGSLIDAIRRGTDKPIIIYPNAGEAFDTIQDAWIGERVADSFAHLAEGWFERGARIIGGCCRTTPDDIRHIYHWAKQKKH